MSSGIYLLENVLFVAFPDFILNFLFMRKMAEKRWFNIAPWFPLF